MNTTSIDVRGPQFPSAQDELAPLAVYLAQLTGEPFQFARMSYGDELTLHFGILRESRSTKLRDRRYGTYILSFRGSPWVLKVGQQPEVLSSQYGYQRLEPHATPKPMTKADIERETLIGEGARVIFAIPYLWKVVGGIGLHLLMSDGTTVTAIPTGPDEADDAPWPELASWELLGPHGLLKVGPGVKWEFVPAQ